MISFKRRNLSKCYKYKSNILIYIFLKYEITIPIWKKMKSCALKK